MSNANSSSRQWCPPILARSSQWCSWDWSSTAGTAGTPSPLRSPPAPPGHPLPQSSPEQQVKQGWNWLEFKETTWIIPRYCRASIRGPLLLPGAWNIQLGGAIWFDSGWCGVCENATTCKGKLGKLKEVTLMARLSRWTVRGRISGRKKWTASEDRMLGWNLEGQFPPWLSPPSRAASPPPWSPSSCPHWRWTAPAGKPYWHFITYIFRHQ